MNLPVINQRAEFAGFMFTFLIFIDILLRGFDEFHSRLLLVNFLIVVYVMVERFEISNKIPLVSYLFLIFNIFNPSTIGVVT